MPLPGLPVSVMHVPWKPVRIIKLHVGTWILGHGSNAPSSGVLVSVDEWDGLGYTAHALPCGLMLNAMRLTRACLRARE